MLLFRFPPVLYPPSGVVINHQHSPHLSPQFVSSDFLSLEISPTASDDEAWLAFRVLLEGRGVEVEALPVTLFHTKLGEKLEFTGFRR